MASRWLMQIQFCTFLNLAQQASWAEFKNVQNLHKSTWRHRKETLYKNILFFLKLNFVPFCRFECWPVVGRIYSPTWSYKSLPFSTTKESCDIWRGQKGQKVPKNKIPSWRRRSQPWICLFQQFKDGHQHNCQIHAYGKFFFCFFEFFWIITTFDFPASSSFKKKVNFLLLK